MKAITKIKLQTPPPKRRKTRVAAYCRVSTGMDDQLQSLETQKSHYEELIKANPDWEYVGIYYDEGISGTNKEKRPALQKMLADCKAGKIDRILTKSLSRFARNTTDCLEMVRKLLDLGVTIYFEKEKLDTGSMESELLLSIMSSLAEDESVSISKNSKWSVRHRFENGTYKLGSVPYGYSVTDGKLSINEEEAKWVRWIFSETLKGESSNAIANRLNDLKVPTRRSNHWTSTTILGMLKNEKYIGDCLFQKTYSDHRFKRHANHGERDQFYEEGHHAAIISLEDFEAAGKLVGQRAHEKGIKKKDPRYRKRYPFSGKLICGECGATLKRRINITGKQRYPVWVCKRHLEEISACGMKYIKESDLEYAFITMINKLVFARKEVLHPLADRVGEQAKKSNLRRIEYIGLKLEENEERARTLATIMSKGYIEPALFAKENTELTAESEALTAEREQLIKVVTGNDEKIKELQRLLEYVDNAKVRNDFDGNLVTAFLNSATIDSRTEITFHLKCGLSLKERM